MSLEMSCTITTFATILGAATPPCTQGSYYIIEHDARVIVISRALRAACRACLGRAQCQQPALVSFGFVHYFS